MSKKREKAAKRIDEDDEHNSSSDDSDCGSDPDVYKGNEEIQVTFEGRNPIDSDFHGIRQLLLQLFLKAHLNLSEMADLIISQNYIGSVAIQSEIDDEENNDGDDDDDEEMYDPNVIFGVTTVINITRKKEIGCIEQLKSYLIEKAEQNATQETKNIIKNYLCDDSQSIGFLINERFINIPSKLSIPLFENLFKEIKRANDKKMDYNFTHYIMLIKFYRKEGEKGKPSEDIYSNPEEEIICKEAIASFEYSVQSECDTGMSGQWLESDDNNLIPHRKCIIFEAEKLPQFMLSITDFLDDSNIEYV